MINQMFKVRVNHELGFYSFYEIEATNYFDAEKQAIETFYKEFCGGEKKYKVEAYTFNKW